MTILLEATVRKFTGEATADQKEAAAARKEVTATAALFAERMTANTTASRNDTAATIETAIEKSAVENSVAAEQGHTLLSSNVKGYFSKTLSETKRDSYISF